MAEGMPMISKPEYGIVSSTVFVVTVIVVPRASPVLLAPASAIRRHDIKENRRPGTRRVLCRLIWYVLPSDRRAEKLAVPIAVACSCSPSPIVTITFVDLKPVMRLASGVM